MILLTVITSTKIDSMSTFKVTKYNLNCA